MFAVGHPGITCCCSGGATTPTADSCCPIYVVDVNSNIPLSPAAAPAPGDIPATLVDGQMIQYDFEDGFIRYVYNGATWSLFVNPDNDAPSVHN